ncbi:hypothetical protein Tco_0520202 [Tanacetum coccineum]
MLKGCRAFLAHVTTKETGGKLKKNNLRMSSPASSTRRRYSENGIQNSNKKEHEEHLKAILEFLKKEELYAKFSKCESWISKIAKPMTKLTQKKVKFEWGDKQETAFQLLKQKLCSAPILALPEGSRSKSDRNRSKCLPGNGAKN